MSGAWRLVNAALLLLLFLMPLMICSARLENRRATDRTLLVVPAPSFADSSLVMAAIRSRGRSRSIRCAARRVQPEGGGAGEELGVLVAPVVDVRRAYTEAGVPIVQGRLRNHSSAALASLERLLSPRRLSRFSRIAAATACG